MKKSLLGSIDRSNRCLSLYVHGASREIAYSSGRFRLDTGGGAQSAPLIDLEKY